MENNQRSGKKASAQERGRESFSFSLCLKTYLLFTEDKAARISEMQTPPLAQVIHIPPAAIYTSSCCFDVQVRISIFPICLEESKRVCVRGSRMHMHKRVVIAWDSTNEGRKED